nr:gustatory receptor for sugar taste 43a-like [Plodia interpunctella]
MIGTRYSRAKERQFCAGFFFFSVAVTLMLVGDICFSVIKAPPHRQWDLVLHYLGFYLLWYFVTILEVQFAVTAMMVYARFRTLNETLSLTAKNLSKPNMTVEPRLLISPTDAIHRNSLLYSKLCDVVRHLENSYSVCLVIILVATLFHLIITPYFAISEINVRVSGNLYQFIILQCMWYSLHLSRLLMIVEPCHNTTAECERTVRLVCRMVLAIPTKGALAFQLELMSRQLMLQPVCYKPMGTCTLGRPLIASVKIQNSP